MSKDPIIRFYSTDPSELLIEARVPEKNNPAVFHAIAFKANAVDYVMEVNDAVSALVLKSGVTIAVAHPFQKLKEMVYDPNFRSGPSLDLTAVTGEAVKNISLRRLADEFKTEAKSLKIRAFLREMYSNRTAQIDFSEADISSYEPSSNTRAKTKESVTL